MTGNTCPNPFKHFIAGVNYMPREHGCQMWSDWSEADIERDFKAIKELNLNAVRTFLFWNDFQPTPDAVSRETVEKFDKMLEIARRYGLKLIPTFFTGHMSGENWDVPWRGGKSIFDDPFMLKSQIHLVRYFAKRYSGNGTILCWDLANEHDSVEMPKSEHSGWLWTHLLYRELKTFDPMHLVTVGTHITSLDENKLRLDMISADFLCTHPYPMYTKLIIDPIDTIRSTLFPAFTSKLSQGLGERRVMLEEFGTSTEMTADEVSSRFYQSVLYSMLINDTIGALAWCFADFIIPERLPYLSTPHELEFGITNCEGRPKLQALVFKEFIKNVEQINYVGLHPERPKAAIILPYRYYDSPYTPIDVYIRSLFSAFVLAKQANIDVDFIKPSDPFDYDLLIVPTVPLKGYLTSMQWKKLVEFVSDGGSLYCSYNGVAFPELEDLFGIDIVSQAFPLEVEDFQLKSKNVMINYHTTLDKVIDVEAQEERVIAWNKNNRPAVVKNHYNKGLTVFVTHPIEYYLSFMPGAAQSNKSYLFYKIAGGMIKNSIEYENQFVESKLFHKEDVKYLILANLENKASTFVVNVDFDYTTIEDLTADNKILHGQDFSVELDSNGYKVYMMY